jgi:hypothetical protein
MGLTKVGLNLGKEILGWTRTGGKSLLITKPVKINTAGLKYAPKLESDTFSISTKVKKAGTVLNTKTNQVEPIIVEEYDPKYSRCYDGLEALNTNGEPIGRVSYINTIDDGGLFYPKDKPSLFIDFIGTKNGYKGIGTELIRKVVNISKELGLGGRVRLNPCTGSVPFEFRFADFYNKCQKSSAAIQYKKMGFKAYDEDIDKLLEQELLSGGNGFVMKNGEILRDKFTAPMYLPKEAIEKYLKTTV